METFLIDKMATPQGELLLIADEKHRLRAIDWTDHYERLMKLLRIITAQILLPWWNSAILVG